MNEGLLNKIASQKKNILTSDKWQGREKVYIDGIELLDEILRTRQYKHSLHIKYLANHHENQIMKIRFSPNPFSFVFLLTGIKQYYIVLETLDLEEATYIWRTEKNNLTLIEAVKGNDNQINIIREIERLAFLVSSPDNFIGILHDYSDKSNGFVLWKNA